MLVNRWDHGVAGVSPLYMPRLNSLTTQLGGVVTITYGQSHACQTAGSYIRLPYDCFPAWFVNDSSSGWTLWNKWKVTQQSSSDSFAGNDTQTPTYSYSTPTWHYSDDPALPDINSCAPCPTRHWNDFRGSEVVTITDGSGAKTEYRFHRGMNDDRATTAGGFLSASVTPSDATTRTDDNWLRGSTPVTYADAAHKHAVSAAFGNTYSYDANGNQTTRNLGGPVYTPTYDYENRLTAISVRVAPL